MNQGNLGVARRQYELTKAGAWIYDIQNQQHLYEALSKTYASGTALLAKYTILAPVDGVVLAVNTATGTFVSTQGTYDTYTQGYDPIIVMGPPQEYLEVRCYIDEILIPRMPPPVQMKAQMQIRGTSTRIPLEFERVQPYVSPKIELSNQTDRAGGRESAAGLVPVQAAEGYEDLSRATGGRLCGNEIIPAARLPLALGSVLSCLWLLAGCAVGPDFERPQPPAATQFTQGREPTATVAGRRQDPAL